MKSHFKRVKMTKKQLRKECLLAKSAAYFLLHLASQKELYGPKRKAICEEFDRFFYESINGHRKAYSSNHAQFEHEVELFKKEYRRQNQRKQQRQKK